MLLRGRVGAGPPAVARRQPVRVQGSLNNGKGNTQPPAPGTPPLGSQHQPWLATRRVFSSPNRHQQTGRVLRSSQSPSPSTDGGGNEGNGGSGDKNEGGGGGGKDDGQPQPSGDGQPEKSGLLKGWEERVAYDPELPVKVALEQVLGVGASVVGDMSSRPNWGLNELDFVLSTLVVGSILNFSIMYLLAPTGAAGGAVGGSLLAKALSDKPLKARGIPGGNMFEAGPYTGLARLSNLGYKGSIFAVLGFSAGILGTTITNFLVWSRKKIDPNFVVQNEQPNILANAATWGLHMGISANLRYQLLGGLDSVLVKVMPIPLFRTYNACIRVGNNMAGGITFVTLSRILGVQKAGEPAPAETA